MGLTTRSSTDERVGRSMRALRALAATLDAITEVDNERALADRVCDVIVRDCGYRLAWIGYRRDDEQSSVTIVGESGYDDGYLANAGIRWSDTERGRGPTGTAIRTARPCVIRNIPTDPRFAPWREQAAQRGYASSIAIPFGPGTPADGALNIYAAEPDAFDDQEIALLSALTKKLGAGIASQRALSDGARAEQELDSQTALLHALYDASPDMIFVHAPDGSLIDVNDNALACYRVSRENMLAAPPGTFMGRSCDPQVALRRITAARAGAAQDFEWIGRTADGEEFPIEVRLRPLAARGGAVLAVVRDLRATKRAEREALRAQKLESLGIFVGGVAHDFNNLLTGVIANLSFAQRKLEAPEGRLEVPRLLADAEQAAVRAGELTARLLTFAKQHEPARKPTDLYRLVEETTRFALSGTAVETEFDVDPELRPVAVDAGQIAQVVHNIALNGAQAMPHGGTISVSLAHRTLDRAFGDRATGGRWIELIISNDGPPIPQADLDRIFDPYFTTKQQGSGLGLATAYSIITAHGGHIGVTSREGQTSFYILLPADEGPEEQPRPEQSPIEPASGRILVMDDDEGIRATASAILEAAGYDVCTADSGEQAVEIYRRERDRGHDIDLVILDVTVRGGSGGVDALRLLQAENPGVRAAASSGYSAGPELSECRDHGFADLLPKPYNADELLAFARRHVGARAR